MNAFNFNSVPNIISGSGKIDELVKVCINNQIFKPIVITDFGIKKQGYVEIIEKILARHNIQISIFEGVKADPPEKNIFDAVNILKKNSCDAVIGLGGGSSMDVAKAVSYFAINKKILKIVMV